MNIVLFLSYDITITLKFLFWHKKVQICHNVCTVVIDVIHKSYQNMSTTSGLSIIMHGVILLPDMTSYDK